jgi:hypothetical protein
MSKERQKNFFDLYLAGRASADDINESIDAWHAGSVSQHIYQFLGMTKEEYSRWLSDPEILPEIASARKQHARLASPSKQAKRTPKLASRTR